MTRVAVVTGASRGIGEATARLAAARGYAVCVNYCADAAGAAAVVADIERGGGTAIAVRADVASEADVDALFARVDRALGLPAALVNNAGILGRPGPIDTADAATIRRLFDVNVLGTMLCARAAARRMSTRRGGAGGVIVNVSSIAARVGAAGPWLPYAASKGAIDTFTAGLAKELAPDGIRVNAVSPGLIKTRIRADAGADPAIDDAIVAQVPLQRIGTPEECAAAILWLLSDEAAYVTGAVLPVTGGR